MSQYAEIDDNNVVMRVIEADHTAHILSRGRFIKTHYHGEIRKNYAGVGCVYDSALDAFIPPKPFASWVLDESTATWAAPSPYPDDGALYEWNEDTLMWVKR